MTFDQIALFSLLGLVFALLIWGPVRFDLVAFAALVIATLLGLVPEDEMFSGFSNSAVIIIALVLIVSRGLMNSGAIELAAKHLLGFSDKLLLHLTSLGLFGAALSAVINNVAALALLMPLDLEAARKNHRSPGTSLMPLSFATILGGMITMIGTPPNIVIAQYRQSALGQSFSMFDFAPVGLIVALAGLAYLTLLGWRLLPARLNEKPETFDSPESLYVAEIKVGSAAEEGKMSINDLLPAADEADVNLLGLIRHGRRLRGFARDEVIQPGDFLVVEGEPKGIEAFMGAAKLDFAGSEKHKGGLTGGNLSLQEVIVPDSARIAHSSAFDLSLLHGHGVTLLGVSRQGRTLHSRVRHLIILPGDVLLLLAPPERLQTAIVWLGVLPLEGRRTDVVQRNKALLAIGSFATAIAASIAGLMHLELALSLCVGVFAISRLVSGREIYEAVEWKVIVLLGSLIPLGFAFEKSGSAQLVAQSIVQATEGMPSWIALAALMVVTMTLSDFLNNVATCLIAAPIGVQIANALDVNPDAFLMGVAVSASCAFLTPIGHKNNTIIMGPGGYRFGDYWRMGLPLELLVLALSIPAILVIWPL